MDDRADLLKLVLERILDGALLLDASGRVEWANPDSQRIFARDRSALARARSEELFAQLPAGWPLEGAHRVEAVRGDGTLVPTRAFVTALGDGYAVTLQDRASEEPTPAMPRSAEDPAAMLGTIAQAVDAFLFAGEVTAGGWYVPIYHSPGLEKLVGGAVEYPDANRVYDQCVYPGDYPAYESLYEFGRRRDGVAEEATYRLRGLDGRVRWVRERSVPQRVEGRLLLFGVVVDVTAEVERRGEVERADAARLAAVARYERAVELASDAMLTCARDGRVRDANPAAHRLLGLDPGKLVGRTLAEVCLPQDVPALRRYLRDEWGGTVAGTIVVRCRVTDGRLVHVSWAGARDPEGDTMFLVGRDVTAEVEARVEMERRSRTDVLTDLFNRRHLVDALGAELERARREPRRPGVLLLDLDHFKTVNDHYGHAAGDDVLREVGKRLRRCVRGYDVVARWGGEEFCVLVAGVANVRALRRVAESLRAAVAETPVAIPGERLVSMTASIGGALARDGLWTVEALVDAADRALYGAKRQGRDRVVLENELTRDELRSEREPESIRLAQALVYSASAREGIPEEHVREVSDLAAAIAVELGATDDSVMRCRLGGWLHDLGKMALPDTVLMKPGELDDEDWALMRTHCEIGERIVRRIPGLAQAAPAIRHHHECWDGTGYPDGLAGERIPLEARIVAVADAYSAITQDRVHREGRPPREALDELRRGSGTRHDPRCVEALAAVLSREGAALVRHPVGG